MTVSICKILYRRPRRQMVFTDFTWHARPFIREKIYQVGNAQAIYVTYAQMMGIREVPVSPYREQMAMSSACNVLYQRAEFYLAMEQRLYLLWR